jgi:2-oxoglutarate dehydrogenase E2 component (dihydrolipoamide succinyltransferase)
VPVAAGRSAGSPQASPLARRIIAERGLEAGRIAGTGPGGRITKDDALRAAEPAAAPPALAGGGEGGKAERETRQPMSRLRRALAERLVAARRETALTTTFNEADLGELQELRRRYGEDFEKRHGVRLGLMSFFVKASCRALAALPAVNSRIEGGDIVTCRYYDIGVAVSTERGLVVPVLREADALSFAEIEKTLAELAQRARRRRPSWPAFTITNGGVFGSLLSPLPITPGGHPGNARHPAPTGGPRGAGGHPADDVPGPVLRSPADRRAGGGAVPGADQEDGGGTREAPPGAITRRKEEAHA